MSVIGLDVGSSAVKGVAYRADLTVIECAQQAVGSMHEHAGRWEVEPSDVWRATTTVLRDLARQPGLASDPPQALAISASGREVFPVAEDGEPLGRCLMTGDLRGAEIAAQTAALASASAWMGMCGHVPDRMDPINRLLWWRQEDPSTLARARWLLGWHEFLALRLTGRPVLDGSLAAGSLAYDLATSDWSPAWLEHFDVDAALLPVIDAPGAVVGSLRPGVAKDLGLPADLVVAVGGWDVSCAALGAGAPTLATLDLAMGSWQAAVAPTATKVRPEALVAHGWCLAPHAGSATPVVYALNPNGAAILQWARDVLGVGEEEMTGFVQSGTDHPGEVLALPELVDVPGGHGRGGALVGLRLGTTREEIIRALAEGLAHEVTDTVENLRVEGIPVQALRITGGVSRSSRLMQLVADLCGAGVAVAPDLQSGTRGAAALAAVATGAFDTIAQAIEASPVPARHYSPSPDRAALHAGSREVRRSIRAALKGTSTSTMGAA